MVTDLLLREMPFIHCARGPKWCPKCKEFQERGQPWSLVRVLFEPSGHASPVIPVEVEGEEVWAEYTIERRFDSEEEARQYIRANSIVLLDDE